MIIFCNIFLANFSVSYLRTSELLENLIFIGLDPRINGIMWSEIMIGGNSIGSVNISSNSSSKTFIIVSYLVTLDSLVTSIEKI
jgi:hypothetical protein